MRVVKETNNYITYEDILNNQDKFNIALSKNINSKIEINVLLSNKLEKVEPNKCYILMENIDINKTREIIMQTWKNLHAIGYNNFLGEIKIIVNNEKELNLATSIVNDNKKYLKINITKSDLFQKENKNKETIEKIMKANTITKIDNGIIRTYTERKADDNNLGYMLEGVTKEEMYNKLQQLRQQNPTILDNKNEKELANIVLDSIAEENNRQKYYLESVLEQKAQDKKGTIAGAVAYKNEGTVNKEIGIVRNSSSQENEINTVEENDNKLKVVTPEINNVTISTNNNTTPNYGFNHQSTNDYYEDESILTETEENLTEEEIQQREVNKTQSYVRRRVLVKPEEHKSAAFISLPVIVLIISGLLLISSAIIYVLSK